MVERRKTGLLTAHAWARIAPAIRQSLVPRGTVLKFWKIISLGKLLRFSGRTAAIDTFFMQDFQKGGTSIKIVRI